MFSNIGQREQSKMEAKWPSEKVLYFEKQDCCLAGVKYIQSSVTTFSSSFSCVHLVHYVCMCIRAL